jgi:photosystem II stability/assembly factor-like uncharacterized protein
LTPTTFYAGTHGGLFKSSNGGETWTPINTGLIETSISGLVADPMMPATLFATLGSGLVQILFKSTDSGKSWHRLDAAGLPAFDPQTPGMLYVAAGDVYQSKDGGESWVQINQTNTGFRRLLVDPMTPTTLYASIEYKEYEGNQAGAGIPTAAGSSGLGNLAIDPLTPTTLYAATWNKTGSVFKSTDGGESWIVSDLDAYDALCRDAKTWYLQEHRWRPELECIW